jgi:phosphocarrier protein
VVRRSLEIRNSLGLHVRPASELAKLAQRFSSRLQVIAGGETVDARSVMGLMTLGLPQGSQLEITADGADETEALEALADLINRGFDEK